MVRSHQIAKRFAPWVALAALAALSLGNWVERGRYGVPEDGVVWRNSEAGVAASRVVSKGPGALVGLRPGDIVRSVAGRRISEAADVTRALYEVGAWNRSEYLIERAGEQLYLSVVVGESTSRGAVGAFLLALGWIYAAIGVWVRRRCPVTPASSRFYAFCMASLAVYGLSASGRLEGLDRLVYWADAWALLLLPPLFLDFCARFPDGQASRQGLVRTAYGLAVAVGAAHHASAGGWVSGGIESPELLSFFSAAPLGLLGVDLAAAGAVVRERARASQDPLRELQSRWLLAGTLAAVVPFTLLYAVPFAAGAAPGANQAFSVFSLAALPLSIAVALARYRLLDFEIAWRRAAAAAAAVAILLSAGYVALFGSVIPLDWLERYGPLVWLGSLALGAGLYRPLHVRLATWLERRRHRDRFEERRALAAFATEIASETDPVRMVASVRSRLARALGVGRIVVLVRAEAAGEGAPLFRAVPAGESGDESTGAALDAGPLAARASGRGGDVVITGESDAALPPALARLGCSHFVPARARGRTIAWIGLGRTQQGRFLSSDDLALVQALSSPFAIALENARLYSRIRARAEEYQRLKDYNENIVESLSVGIVVLDEDGLVQSWNTQLELALHISRDQARGRMLKELLPPELAALIRGCQDEKGAGSIAKFPLRSSDFPEEFRPADPGDPAERILNIAVAPLIDKGFRRVGQLLILDDVTERVELEERVVQADKLSSVGLLAAGVAHEVNTPLAVISSYSQLLAAKVARGSEEERMLEKVADQTFRASEIVNSLLDFSRASSAGMARCDISRVIRDTLDLVSPQLRKAGVEVELQLSEGAWVLASRNRLQQVFLNLFLNARDAMGSGGSLRVASRLQEPSPGDALVSVRVSDTGAGIAPEALRRVFDPFFTTKEARKGTGLGLAVSYGIVREHSGTIAVASRPGEGTTFDLRFPLAAQPAHA